jgi:membrane-associated protease RseP (regulator of RpoE activity)
MVLGVYRTLHASSQAIANFPTLPVAWFKSSFLTGALLSLLAPKMMTLPLSQPIPIHPLFVVGFSGLLSSALNLLPVTRLDGGRACFAAMGPKYGEMASLATFLCVLIALISKESASTLLWSWIMFVLLFQRQSEIPSRDNYTEINDFRLNSWVCAVVFSILTLVPFPGYKRLAPTGL